LSEHRRSVPYIQSAESRCRVVGWFSHYAVFPVTDGCLPSRRTSGTRPAKTFDVVATADSENRWQRVARNAWRSRAKCIGKRPCSETLSVDRPAKHRTVSGGRATYSVRTNLYGSLVMYVADFPIGRHRRNGSTNRCKTFY